MAPRLDVYKLGGVAVGSAEAIRAGVRRIAAAPGRVAVVVSAMNGVTDQLLGAASAALAGDRDAWAAAARAFETRHRQLVEALVADPARAAALRALLAEASGELQAMCESVGVLRELTPRVQDALVARGERALARIFVAALEEAGLRATYVDATEVVLTERRLGSLWPVFAACAKQARALVLPRLDEGHVVVVPGFLGRGPGGEVVTLGRGGTDFSAAILARSLGADALTLWKEVDGLMTADPRRVPAARLLPELHYREAAELAYYGAKVLHPRTMVPLIDGKIPLHVRSAFGDGPGTRIADDVRAGSYPVRALTAVYGQSLVAIEGGGMIGVPGVAGRAFTALSQAGHSVAMISQGSSEASICFVVPREEAPHAVAALEQAFALERRARLIDRLRVDDTVALVAVVGLGMRHRPGVAARVFTALAQASVNVAAIAQGSSELNITVAVSEADATRALLALHEEFQLDKVRPLDDASGRGSRLALLGLGQIGRALVAQLVQQEPFLRQQLGLDVRVTALADRSGVRVEEDGFDPGELARIARRKAGGSGLLAGTGDAATPPGAAVASGDDAADPLEALRGRLRAQLWPLPSRRPILVDLTAEETGPLLLEALEQGFHVVLANKKPLAGTQESFELLLETARRRRLALRYEATAGAGLPVLDTLAKLQETGDRVEAILGCFSGTLGFLMSALEEGRPFSAAVREAWQRGYTEPDPRDDLSGLDVARKALILARTLGRRVEPAEVALEPLYGAEVDDPDPARFVAKLVALDEELAARAARARRDGRVLRYVARIGRRRLRVGLEAVPEASALGRLRGTDNQVVIHSRRYRDNPLVVTGPGAGAAVTAAGVLNDIVAITVQERRGLVGSVIPLPKRGSARPRRAAPGPGEGKR